VTVKQVAGVGLRVVGLLAIVAMAAFALLVWRVDALGRRDLARPADAIVVLGARVDPDGRPGSDLMSRTYHAVDLWNAGIAAHIICTGGFKGDRLSAAAVCGRFAAELGVPEERIWLADGSSNTAEDARAAAQIMAENGWRSVVLVSHPLHLFRARWLFRRNGVNAATSPTSTDTGRIFPPLRLWYAVREAGAVVLMSLDDLGLVPAEAVARLQDWSTNLP
jgi:uncharacterized SAM-binding protein YcdF (DUF218 family)